MITLLETLQTKSQEQLERIGASRDIAIQLATKEHVQQLLDNADNREKTENAYLTAVNAIRAEYQKAIFAFMDQTKHIRKYD